MARPFTAFDVGAPNVVKRFSEDLRRVVEEGLGGDTVFPAPRRWKREIRELVSDAIFHGSVVKIDRAQLRKPIVLQADSSKDLLPFMSWSAGQREFMLLLLGLYTHSEAKSSGTTPREERHCIPSARARREMKP